MSVISGAEAPHSTWAARVRDGRFGTWGAVLAGLALNLVLTFGHAVAVWRDGMFFNPDDAMRLVQVRDLLAGQGWYDLVEHRLSPDHPFAMHWSRLVDVPLALSIKLLSLVTTPEMAELLVRLIEPTVLLVVMLAALVRVADSLLGPRARLPAALLAAGSIELVSAFIPGHIHHHGIQIALLGLSVAWLLDGLDPRTAARAGWAGAVSALSLGIGLQSLPFVVAEIAVLGLFWIWQGARHAHALAVFGLGLAIVSLGVFVIDVAPADYGHVACDAFSIAHLAAGVAGGAVLSTLALASWRLETRTLRISGAGLGLALLLLLGRSAFPACLGDPYGAVDPFLKTQWLSQVSEAMPLTVLIGRAPITYLPIAIGLLAGLAGTIWAACRAKDVAALRWTALAVLSGLGALGTLWEVRIAASTQMLMVPGLAFVVLRLAEHRWGRKASPSLVLTIVGGLLLTQIGWSALLAPLASLRPSTPVASTWPMVDPNACLAPAAYRALAALPPGLVLSTIDPGSTILAATPDSVLAAPYHRDGYGNVLSLKIFQAGPDAAEAMVRSSKATYVVVCRASPEMHDFAVQTPDGFAATLLRGHPPGWLRQVGPNDDPISVYKVDRALPVRP